MRLVVLGCSGALLVLGVIVLVGFVLPSERQGRAERLVRAEPEVVQGVILDVTRQPEWRAGVTKVELNETGWVEITARGETVTFVVEVNGPGLIRLRFASSQDYHGTWEGILTPVEQEGQILTWVQVTESAVTPSPVGRILSRLFFDPEAFSRSYLDALQGRVEGGA
ncbi:MAG: hypothetical protein NTX73_04715 [Rhodobacterales bacterium]|nr:hypothetical protein [Rhodobacterales bacterium]